MSVNDSVKKLLRKLKMKSFLNGDVKITCVLQICGSPKL